MYKRAQYQTIIKRLKEPRHFLQVVLGPRQVGKTTVVKQVLSIHNNSGWRGRYESRRFSKYQSH